MFPEAPADSLFWDFIDTVGNQTAPKSIYLGNLAGTDSDTSWLRQAVWDSLGHCLSQLITVAVVAFVARADVRHRCREAGSAGREIAAPKVSGTSSSDGKTPKHKASGRLS